MSVVRSTYMDKPLFHGQSVTYGDNINDIKIGSSMKNLGVIDGRNRNAHRLWGHILSISDDSIECSVCDMEQEIPDIVRKGPPHRAAIYRMYMFGEFQASSCEEKSVIHSEPGRGSIVDIGGNQYRYTGNEKWISMTPPHEPKTTSDIIEEKQHKIDKQRKQRYGDPILSDRSSGVHHDSTPISFTVSSDNLSKDEKKSLTERLTDRIK